MISTHSAHVLIFCVIAFIVIEALLMWWRSVKR